MRRTNAVDLCVTSLSAPLTAPINARSSRFDSLILRSASINLDSCACVFPYVQCRTSLFSRQSIFGQRRRPWIKSIEGEHHARTPCRGHHSYRQSMRIVAEDSGYVLLSAASAKGICVGERESIHLSDHVCRRLLSVLCLTRSLTILSLMTVASF